MSAGRYEKWCLARGFHLSRNEKRVLEVYPDAWPEPAAGGWFLVADGQVLVIGCISIAQAFRRAAEGLRCA